MRVWRAVAWCVAAASLGAPPALRGQESAVARGVETPAGPASGMYALGPGPQGPILSWLDPLEDGGHVLRFAFWTGRAWSAPREVARGARWFANWADHPAVVGVGDGSLVAHWLVRSGDGTSKYGYGIRLARSVDAGRTWTPVFTAEPTGDDYTGFVTVLPLDEGFAAAYLAPDGTAPAATGHAAHGAGHAEPIKTLNWTRFSAGGDVLATERLDADVCSCCTTAAVATARGPLVAYRDRTGDEVRDIAIVRRLKDGWSRPRVVHDDGWRIPGCPTNGPAVAADGDRVVVAWFTAAGGAARVLAAVSHDGGDTFTAPVRIDEGTPVGWTGAALTEEGDAVVSWLEGAPGGAGQVRLRRLGPSGALGSSIVAAASKGGRATGIPQIARSAGDLIVAWRDGGVRSAVLPLTRVPAVSRAAPVRD